MKRKPDEDPGNVGMRVRGLEREKQHMPEDLSRVGTTALGSEKEMRKPEDLGTVGMTAAQGRRSGKL